MCSSDLEDILRHLDKAHKLYSIIGHDDAAAEVQMCMAKVLGDSQDPMSELKHWKMLYKKNVEEDGEGSSCAFYAGKELFKVLRGQEGKGVKLRGFWPDSSNSLVLPTVLNILIPKIWRSGMSAW